jgi:hypothetical protein
MTARGRRDLDSQSDANPNERLIRIRFPNGIVQTILVQRKGSLLFLTH